jgi:hypothetical protein
LSCIDVNCKHWTATAPSSITVSLSAIAAAPYTYDSPVSGYYCQTGCSGTVDTDFPTATATYSSSAPVGGVVVPGNEFAILAPWLTVIGLVGCIGTVAIVVGKRCL